MKAWREEKQKQQQGQPQAQQQEIGLTGLLKEVNDIISSRAMSSVQSEQLDGLKMILGNVVKTPALAQAELAVTQAESRNPLDIKAWDVAVDRLVAVKKEIMDHLVTQVTPVQLKILENLPEGNEKEKSEKLALQTFINKIEIERNLLLQVSDPSLMKAWVGRYDEGRFAQLSSFLLEPKQASAPDQSGAWKQNFAGVLLQAAQDADKTAKQNPQQVSAVEKVLKLSEKDDNSRELLHYFAKNYHSLTDDNKTVFQNYIVDAKHLDIYQDQIPIIATLINQTEKKEERGKLYEKMGLLGMSNDDDMEPRRQLFQNLEAGEKRAHYFKYLSDQEPGGTERAVNLLMVATPEERRELLKGMGEEKQITILTKLADKLGDERDLDQIKLLSVIVDVIAHQNLKSEPMSNVEKERIQKQYQEFASPKAREFYFLALIPKLWPEEAAALLAGEVQKNRQPQEQIENCLRIYKKMHTEKDMQSLVDTLSLQGGALIDLSAF